MIFIYLHERENFKLLKYKQMMKLFLTFADFILRFKNYAITINSSEKDK